MLIWNDGTFIYSLFRHPDRPFGLSLAVPQDGTFGSWQGQCRASQVLLMENNPPVQETQETQVQFPGQEDTLE